MIRNKLQEDYFMQRNHDNIIKTREILSNLPEFCQDYFVAIENTTSALSRLNYAYDLRVFFYYLMTETNMFEGKLIEEITVDDMNKINAKHIERFISYISQYEYNGKLYTNGECGKARKLASIRAFFKYLFKNDLIKANNADKVSMPKRHEKEIIRLEPNEVAKLINESETGYDLIGKQKAFHQHTQLRDTALLTLLLGTGMRISECVGLNVDDIDFSTNALKITRKGGNRVVLYFGDEVKKALVEYLNARDQMKIDPGEKALFLSLQRKRMTPRAIQKLVKKYSEIITPLKHITPHKLRSTFGTALYRETQDIYIVADVLGHKDVNTTRKHYAAISDDLRRKVAGKVVLRDKEE